MVSLPLCSLIGGVSTHHEATPKNGFCEKTIFSFVSGLTIVVVMLVGCCVVFFVVAVGADVINCTNKVCNVFCT